MGLLSKLLPAAGSVLGTVIGGPVGGQIGGALGSAVAGSGASKKAMKAQIEAEKRAQARYDTALGNIKGYEQPYADAGTEGLNALRGRFTDPAAGSFGHTEDPTYTAPGAFTYTAADYMASPGYQFQQDEARRAILASASATGALQSGAALKELQDRAQQIALQDFNNERAFNYDVYKDSRNFGRDVYDTDRNYLTDRYDTGTNNLFRLTGVGQQATGLLSNAELERANLGANSDRNVGQAKASNALTQGDIWGNLASGLGGYLSGAGRQNALASDLRRSAAANPQLF